MMTLILNSVEPNCHSTAIRPGIRALSPSCVRLAPKSSGGFASASARPSRKVYRFAANANGDSGARSRKKKKKKKKKPFRQKNVDIKKTPPREGFLKHLFFGMK